MNERLPVDRLREALHRADIAELDHAADELGRQAVAVALEEPITFPASNEGGKINMAERYKPSDEEERQRLLDAGLADSIEIVARHRMRLGRRVCTQTDGKAVRLIFETLRGMQPESSDQGFPS